MNRLFTFVRNYRLFSVSLLISAIGLVLQLTGNDTAARWLLTGMAGVALLPLLYGMWQDFRHGTYGVDILAATAIITSLILGEYWAAIVIVLMLTGGESLERYAHHRAQSELDALLEHAPHQATVIRKGKTVSVDVNDVRIGDKLSIKAGEVVAVDAIIIEGEADFDESSLTGESLPQHKVKGEQLLSGSINLDGSITAKAIASAADSQYQQIIKLVRSASASQAPFVRLADRYSLPFTFAAFALASTVWIISGDPQRFLEVIVVATPCPLILAAPIALVSGMARASRFGIIVKTGSALEKLAEARAIAFDKTGTLTRGELSVHAVKPFGKFTQDEILGLTAGVEQHSAHIIGQAIVTDAQLKGIKLAKTKHVKELVGRGLSTTVKGKQVLVGRLDLLLDNDVRLPARFKPDSIRETAVYVAIDGELAGVITLRDDIRPETPATLTALRQAGLKQMLMVTGDNKTVAQAVGHELGITKIHANSLPADKLHAIEGIKQRPLAFVGDGVNDAPILTASDIGIALGARGSTAASESADMVIMKDDISKVADAHHIARRTFTIARQSIFIGIGLSLGLMLIFATGKFTPLAGALVQEVVDVIVIFYALRAHMITPANS